MRGRSLIMGATAVVVASISDGLYAVLVGGAGRRITEASMRWLSRISGGVLIGGGAVAGADANAVSAARDLPPWERLALSLLRSSSSSSFVG